MLAAAAGLSTWAIDMAGNPGATEAAAQSSALGTLAWISVAVSLVTLVITLMLRKPAGGSAAQTPATPAAAAPPAA